MIVGTVTSGTRRMCAVLIILH